MDGLVEATEGFTGAGIERAMVSARFADDQADGTVTTETLLSEIAATQPLPVIMDTQIQRLSAWARDRTAPTHVPVDAIMLG